MRCNYPDNWATHAALQSSVCLPQWPTINEFFRLLWKDIANLEFHYCLLHHVITYHEHICIVDNSDKLRIFREPKRTRRRAVGNRVSERVHCCPLTRSLQAQLVAHSPSETASNPNRDEWCRCYLYTSWICCCHPKHCFLPLMPSASTASLSELSPLIH